MRPTITLRTRLFVALLLAAVIPSGLLLLGGTLAFREAVVSTGTAGPWGQVAESGGALLDELDGEVLPPAVVEAAEQHRAHLSESVRLSRIFTLVGERLLLLLPALALGVLLLAAALALLVANRVSRSISEPVEELIAWTRSLGRGDPLPPPRAPTSRGGRIREFQTLRDALRTMEAALHEARVQELERERTRSWSEMARRVAHDLKNPLTPMSMAAHAVSRSPDPATAEAGRILTEEIRRLDELARSFAQFGRPSEGPPSEVELGELLRELHRRLGLHAPGETDESVHLQLPDGEEEFMVQGHPAALERALRNLVTNALEATKETGSSTPVELRLDIADDATRRISIRDRGPGLPSDDADRIWEPDFTTKRRGTGLGLPLVRQVVLAHGGRVVAQNREGGGAEFRVELPPVPSFSSKPEGAA